MSLSLFCCSGNEATFFLFCLLCLSFANAAAYLLSCSCLACVQPLSSSIYFASTHDVGFLWPILTQSPSKSSKNDDNHGNQTIFTDTKTAMCRNLPKDAGFVP